jgi:hypothetical protein
MDMETQLVELLGVDGQRIQAEFIIWDADPDNPDNIKLALRFANRKVVFSADDYFSAMCSIRLELEQDGLLLNCYGASRNVRPSPMSIDMGAGEKAYRLKLGEQAHIVDLVSIFDSGPDVEPVTVDAQEAFFNSWIASLNA